MKKLNRLFVAVVLFATMLSLTGCWITEPKTQFLGIIKNVTQYRVITWEPANPAAHHLLDPNVHFGCELTGSREYLFKAWLEDGTIVAEFRGRINQLSHDAPINGVNMDWAWVIGGPFYACVTPINPGDAQSLSVTITDFHSELPGMTAPSVKMFRDTESMNASMEAFDASSAARQIERAIALHYNQEVK